MKVNINLISNAILGKSFEEIKCYMESNDVEVKENDKLYMLNVHRNKEMDNNLTELERQCNGIIMEKSTNKIVALNRNKMFNIEQLDEDSKTSLSYEFCEDGTLIRLYNYDNNWRTATSRCIDGKRSYYWSSKQSYDDMFWELFPIELLNELDNKCTYLFILLHQDNKYIVKHKENKLVYISCISNETFKEDNNFPKQFDIPSIKSYEKLTYDQYQYFKVYGTDDKRGVIVHHYETNTDTWRMYKRDFENFKMIQMIRGNNRDIKMRILEIQNDKNMIEQFTKIYPEHNFTVAMVLHSLGKLSRSIYNLYVNSHILQKIQVKQDNVYYRILKQLHAQYKSTKTPITLKDVENKLNSYHPYILRRYLDWV